MMTNYHLFGSFSFRQGMGHGSGGVGWIESDDGGKKGLLPVMAVAEVGGC